MNKFDIRYEIRRAGIQDKAKIMDFIKHQWKKTHILANDSSFFDYEFREEEDLNFIVAFEKQNDELAGIIGYIKASNNTELLDVWGVMWKVADSLNPMPFLGLELMKRMISYTKCRAEIGVGANIHTSVPMLKMFLKFEVNKMDHFYRIADLNDYKIADINKKIFVAQSCAANSYLQVIRNVGELETLFDFSQFKNMIPYKDLWYINKRFLNHPIYKYLIWGVKSGGTVKSILIAREVEHNERKALRIVDYIGEKDTFMGLYNEFAVMLNDYEYIDCYCYGMNPKVMHAAGFIKRNDLDNNIIPNYFEPFVKENIDIWVNSNLDGCFYFKGDGDQDRPNIMNRLSDAEQGM